MNDLFDLDQAITETADQFRAVKARNVRWCLTSIPADELADRYGIERADAIALRELAFDEVQPRLVEIVGEQRRGRGADLNQRAGESGYRARKAITHGAWLANPHITVAEVAELVDVHASTARLYLRELRLHGC